jgi:hypothetical protein
VVRSLANRRSAEGGFKGWTDGAIPTTPFSAGSRLRALRAPYDRDKLCGAMARHTRAANRVTPLCATAAERRKKIRFPSLADWLGRPLALGDPTAFFSPA